MVPKYKLIYFDTQGVGEPIRYIFAYLNLDYEDVRISRAEWSELRTTSPFGRIPILEIDGKPISQSKAIGRYLANQYGLTGKDEWESLQCDLLVDTLTDFTQGFFNLSGEKDQQKRSERLKDIIQKDVPFYFERFDKIIAANPEGYLVGSQVTWADLAFAATSGYLDGLKPGFFKPYPAVNSHLEKISNIPGIKKWIEKRPINPVSFVI